MKPIPTAKEVIRSTLALTNAYNPEVEQKMIEFAKLHVAEAIEEIINTGVIHPYDKVTVRNAYPLSKII